MSSVLGSILGGGGITGALGDILGSSSSTSGASSGTRKTTGRAEEYLEIDQAAIEKIISDVLGGTQGLANIFSGEKATGLYSSSVASQEAGDLIANLVGEIAKLTAKKVGTTDTSETTTSQQSQSQESGGLLGQVGSLLSGIF